MTFIGHGKDGSMSKMMDGDLVLCIKYLSWPNSARDWKTRNTNGGWPPKALKENIVKEGCHLVPVSHVNSEMPQFDWRISFSSAERDLAMNIQPTLKSAYLLVKIILKSLKLKRYGITSYHLKTTFYWLCEEEGDNFHSCAYSEIAQIFFQIFDEFIENLKAGIIKHYFISSNNLLEDIPTDHINKALDLLEAAREAPLLLFSEFAVSVKFFGFYELPPFEIFQPIVDLLLTEKRNDGYKVQLSCAKARVIEALIEFNVSTWLQKEQPVGGFYLVGELIFYMLGNFAKMLVREKNQDHQEYCSLEMTLGKIHQKIDSLNVENGKVFKDIFSTGDD